MFKRILVATDLGEASKPALDRAVELANRFDSELTLVHIWEVPSYEYMGGVPLPIDFAERVSNAAKARLDGLLESIRPQCAHAKGVLRFGVTWREVLNLVQETQPDLLVIGTHGRQGFKRALLGSVAEKLVRSSTVPVLTVHSAPK